MIKVAIVVLSEMEEHQDLGRVVNALQIAREFKEAGDEVQIIFDGGGTVAAVTLADPEDKRHALYAQVEDKVAVFAATVPEPLMCTRKQRNSACRSWLNTASIQASAHGWPKAIRSSPSRA